MRLWRALRLIRLPLSVPLPHTPKAQQAASRNAAAEGVPYGTAPANLAPAGSAGVGVESAQPLPQAGHTGNAAARSSVSGVGSASTQLPPGCTQQVCVCVVCASVCIVCCVGVGVNVCRVCAMCDVCFWRVCVCGYRLSFGTL